MPRWLCQSQSSSQQCLFQGFWACWFMSGMMMPDSLASPWDPGRGGTPCRLWSCLDTRQEKEVQCTCSLKWQLKPKLVRWGWMTLHDREILRWQFGFGNTNSFHSVCLNDCLEMHTSLHIAVGNWSFWHHWEQTYLNTEWFLKTQAPVTSQGLYKGFFAHCCSRTNNKWDIYQETARCPMLVLKMDRNLHRNNMNNTHVCEASVSFAVTHGQSLELFLWCSISCSLQQLWEH